MGKYRSLGTKFDNVYRNDLNANFDDIDKDIKSQKTRVDNLIQNAPQPSEVVDIRQGVDGVVHPTAKERIDTEVNSINAQLAQIATNIYNYKHLVIGEDWTNAIETALNDLKGTNKKLYFPNGTYKISSTNYVLDGSINLEGESDNAIIKGINQRLFNVKNTSKVVLTNLRFDDIRIVLDGQEDYTYSIDELIITNCIFNVGYGVTYLSKTGVKQAYVAHNKVNSGVNAFVMGDNTTNQDNWSNITFFDNEIKNLYHDGAVVHGIIIYGTHVNISNNKLRNLTGGTTTVVEGIYTKSTFSNITDNHLYNAGNVQGSIVIKGRPRTESDQSTPNGFMTVCSNNTIINSLDYQQRETIGITVDSEDVIVDRNRIFGVTSVGIDVTGTTKENVSVLNNFILDVDTKFNFTGIRVTSGNNIKIFNNTVNNIRSEQMAEGISCITSKNIPQHTLIFSLNTLSNLISGNGYALGFKLSSTNNNIFEGVIVNQNTIDNCTHGLSFVGSQTSDVRVSENTFKNIATRITTNTTPPTFVKFKNNVGFMTESQGVSTIPNGSTYVTVYNDVAVAPNPSNIQVTPNSNLSGKNYWVSDISKGAFRITIDSAHTSDLTFAWKIG